MCVQGCCGSTYKVMRHGGPIASLKDLNTYGSRDVTKKNIVTTLPRGQGEGAF